ncbi:MAG: glycoside hydrolase family 16 protein [Microthrixaceae bacterium]|nr:glycoside hydrolase family 16 protein [Microthrixaceae bacterium]
MSDVAHVASAQMKMAVDDGAVVYVNGNWAASDNMPTMASYDTWATTYRDGSQETAIRSFALDPYLFVEGVNTIAVEVHQSWKTSGDLRFQPVDLTVTYGTPPPPPPPAPGWSLTWSDEFDGTYVDTNKWNIHHDTYGDGNNELACLTPNNLIVAGGTLKLQGRKETVTCPSGAVRSYTSGHLNTNNKFMQRGGRFEVRAKLPEGKGLWPAFWLRSNQGWPEGGEIDIMEYIGSEGDKIHGTLHWEKPDGSHAQSASAYSTGADLDAGWHTYGLDWELFDAQGNPTGDGISSNPAVSVRFTWTFDGQPYFQITEFTSNFGYPDPFDQKFYIRLNLAIGGNWPGAPDQTTQFPANYEVDWVRVYQKNT